MSGTRSRNAASKVAAGPCHGGHVMEAVSWGCQPDMQPCRTGFEVITSGQGMGLRDSA